MKPKILIVDDEMDTLQGLEWALSDDYDITTCDSGKKALSILKVKQIDLVLLDIRMPEMDGIETLEHIKAYDSEMSVIMVSGKNDSETIVKAMTLRASNYIDKPVDPNRLRVAIETVLNQKRLQQEVNWIKKGNTSDLEYYNIITTSHRMKPVIELIQKLRGQDSFIVILGERGTGKELIAKAIHLQEEDPDRKFYPLDCNALSAELVDDELFGHEPGAFTGATHSRPGIFELVNGGDIFLDNIEEIPLPTQAKLLRVLQEKKVKRLGGTTEIDVSFRLICAAAPDLKQKVNMGMFRQDLYYRLNVVEITIPPLRERKEDIGLLASYFVDQFSKGTKKISPEAIASLKDYRWQGNIKELQNTIENLCVTCTEDTIRPYHVPKNLRFSLKHVATQSKDIGLKNALKAVEKNIIYQALLDNDWQILKTATALKLSRSKLYEKIKVFNIKKPNSKELRDAIRNLFIPAGYNWETFSLQEYVNTKPNNNIWDTIYKMRGFKDEKHARKSFIQAIQKYADYFSKTHKDDEIKKELKERSKKFVQETLKTLSKRKASIPRASKEHNVKEIDE